LALDAVLVRDWLLGGHDPTLVIVQSYAWILGAACQRNKTQALHHFDVQDWLDRVVKYVELVQQTFPNSEIMWRTSHMYQKNMLVRPSWTKYHELGGAVCPSKT
jgi:hypothetical protein